MLKTTNVYEDNEWTLNHRLAQPGDSWVPLARRNGIVVDVPVDPTAKSVFMERFPYSPVTPATEARVFIYRPIQVFLSGRMSHGGGAYADMTSTVSCTYPADSWQSKLADTPPLHFPDGSEFFCCIPKESMLMWERRSSIMEQGEERVVANRSCQRHRLLIVQGRLLVNGTERDGPTVVSVNAGDTLKAVSKVYAAEVWV